MEALCWQGGPASLPPAALTPLGDPPPDKGVTQQPSEEESSASKLVDLGEGCQPGGAVTTRFQDCRLGDWRTKSCTLPMRARSLMYSGTSYSGDCQDAST